MSSIAEDRPSNFIGRIIVFCVLTCCVSVSGEAEQTSQSADIPLDALSILESEETRDAYRTRTRDRAVASLASTSLSQEHQELLADAISKMYLGIPVSSYTLTARAENSDEEEPVESSNTWTVRASGQIHNADESVVHELEEGESNSPFQGMLTFMYLAENPNTIPMVLNESESEVTFVLELDSSPMVEGMAEASKQVASELESEAEPEIGSETQPFSEAGAMLSLGGAFKNAKFVSEITVDKLDPSVTSLVAMKLEKPLRKRFLFKITTFQMELQFTYVESCDGYAVNKQTMEMEGSALGVGKFSESETTTFTDIVCEQPVRYLLPEGMAMGLD